MKKTSKKPHVLKHFNDKFDSRVKKVMETKKKFMDGGTAGVVNNYNDIKYGTGGANPGTGKSYMSGNPAPAFKKGGMKKYQDGGAAKPKSDTTYGKVVKTIEFKGNKGKPQGAPKKKVEVTPKKAVGGEPQKSGSYNLPAGYEYNYFGQAVKSKKVPPSKSTRQATTAGDRYSGVVGYDPKTNKAHSKMKKGGSIKRKK